MLKIPEGGEKKVEKKKNFWDLWKIPEKTRKGKKKKGKKANLGGKKLEEILGNRRKKKKIFGCEKWEKWEGQNSKEFSGIGGCKEKFGNSAQVPAGWARSRGFFLVLFPGILLRVGNFAPFPPFFLGEIPREC